ncbi:DUF6973 domain-containing protein [Altibacter sp. HG106]|uniref:DUF6973 domain-containing protein n=1 Tax=Altibacter sp. HG106 TaxID=3023937 RepID=UPI0023503D69|nr:hypothetical protein [Altibacter sp. HG106]MDC7995068.1 hypothetical protein [Altibacter sp. HG106]
MKHPLYLIPTLRATRETMMICNKRFGNSHHRSNQANAFRHALWNILICRKSFKKNKNKLKAIHFTQKFTNLYEKVTQNSPLDEAMDLHNNRIGLHYFDKQELKTIEEWLTFLDNLSHKAQKVTQIEEIEQFPESLVFIE